MCLLGSPTECNPSRVGKCINSGIKLDQDCTLLDFRLRTDFGPEFAESCALFRLETGLWCSFESNRATRSLPNFGIAIRSTGLSWMIEFSLTTQVLWLGYIVRRESPNSYIATWV